MKPVRRLIWYGLHSVKTSTDGYPVTKNSSGCCWRGRTIGDVFVRPRPTFLKPFSVEVPWYSHYRRVLIWRPSEPSYRLAHKECRRVQRQRPLTLPALYRRRRDVCTGRCCSVLNAARTLRRVTSMCLFPWGKRYGRRPRSAVEVKATVVQWLRRVLRTLFGWGIYRLVFSGSPPQRIWKLFLTTCTPSLSAEIVQ